MALPAETLDRRHRISTGPIDGSAVSTVSSSQPLAKRTAIRAQFKNPFKKQSNDVDIASKPLNDVQ
jgi:hypothetical protein